MSYSYSISIFSEIVKGEINMKSIFRIRAGTLPFRISVGPTLIHFRENSHANTLIQVPTIIKFLGCWEKLLRQMLL